MVSVAPERESGRTWYFRRRLGGDDLDDGGVHLEVVEVDRRDAVLAREQAGDLLVLDEPEADDGLPDLAPAAPRVVQSVLELLGRNHVLLQQQLSEPDGHADPPADAWILDDSGGSLSASCEAASRECNVRAHGVMGLTALGRMCRAVSELRRSSAALWAAGQARFTRLRATRIVL